MNSTKANQLIDQSLESLGESLEAGHSSGLRDYLKAVSKFHNYSLSNTFLIWAQSPQATHVAGFYTWKKLSRWVRKGEKGIAIIAPIQLKREPEEHTDTRSVSVRSFRVVYVFDIRQTDGKPLPALSQVQGDPRQFSLKLDKCIQNKGIKLSYSDSLRPLGVSKGGEIEIQSGLSPALEFSVKVHELAHEILHHDAQPLSKTQMEMEAEAVSYVVASWIGLDTKSAFSDYIQSYGADKQTLLKSLEGVRSTSHQIIHDLELLEIN